MAPSTRVHSGNERALISKLANCIEVPINVRVKLGEAAVTAGQYNIAGHEDPPEPVNPIKADGDGANEYELHEEDMSEEGFDYEGDGGVADVDFDDAVLVVDGDDEIDDDHDAVAVAVAVVVVAAVVVCVAVVVAVVAVVSNLPESGLVPEFVVGY